MKQIETIKSGKNFTAVTAGSFAEIIEHELPMGPDFTLHGKVFLGKALGATGAELSFQTLVPGQDSGFLHTHKTHEELYFILRGEGTYQVDGELFPVSEGAVVWQTCSQEHRQRESDDVVHPVQSQCFRTR